jgi:hypothetical protein
VFGLLNPFALWLAPLLAGPLLIHFLGRLEPKLRDFPSLMPVRGRLTQAMQRHRLKNWLQLLLRTLALLFLLLAAANPLWRSSHALTPPQASCLLIHNGAYGAIPMTRETIAGETVLASEKRVQRGLDSLTFGHNETELLFPEMTGGESAARFGHYSEALSRLLSRVGAEKGMNRLASVHLYIPVFDWRDLEESQEILLRALEQNPGLRIVLTEYPEAPEKLSPFSEFTVGFPKENIAVLQAGILPSSGSTTALWNPTGESPREIPIAKDSVRIQIPLSFAASVSTPSKATWLSGEVSLAPSFGERFAYPSVAVSAHVLPPSTTCHVGNAFVSLASLGKGGPRSQIKSFADAQELGSEHCDFLYLADPKDADASLLEKAAEIIREGGKVILGVGPNSDLTLLNRNLLEPLGVGRLSELMQHNPIAVKANAEAFSSLGMHTQNWQEPGTVKSHVVLVHDGKDKGTTVLLSAGEDPILVHRKIGNGSLLLWTTDVDDPDWTDLGLGPWVVLINQAFAAGTWNSGIGIQGVASDSAFLLLASESDEVHVTDPAGSPFQGLERDPQGWRIGPFDRLGLYRIEWHHGGTTPGTPDDTSWLAVNLAANRLPSELQSEPSATRAQDRFLSALGPLRSQVVIREAGDDWRNLYGGFRLRTWMLVAAALLLFLEGLVSLRLRPMPFVARRD